MQRGYHIVFSSLAIEDMPLEVLEGLVLGQMTLENNSMHCRFSRFLLSCYLDEHLGVFHVHLLIFILVIALYDPIVVSVAIMMLLSLYVLSLGI